MAHLFDANLRFFGNTNPLTSDYTCGASATLLVLGIVTGGPTQRSGTAPTYNGVALTQADETRQYATNPEVSCELWYLLEPAVSAAYEISIPNPTSLTLSVQASSYSVSSGFTSALDVDGGGTGYSTASSVSVTTTEDGDVVVGVMGSGEDVIPTAETFNELNTTDNGPYSDSNQFIIRPTAGAVTIGWTTHTYGRGVYGVDIYNGYDDWCICVAAFEETNIVTTVTPTVIALTLSLPIPAILTGDDIAVLPSVVALIGTLNAPVISISESHAATALTGTLTLPAPSVTTITTPVASALPLSLSIGSVSILIQQDATILAAVSVLTATIQAPNTLAPLDTIRMMPFIYSSNIAYMTEFGEEYTRFYYNSNPLLGAGEVHVEIATPYQSSELYQLQTRQIADVMWLVHPDHSQAKLKRTTPTTFVLEDIIFDKGPFLERNDLEIDDGVTMDVNVTDAGDTGTLVRSSGTFHNGHVGALFKLTHPRTNRQTNGTKAPYATGIIGEAIEVFGDYIFSITTGDWVGAVRLQRSTDDWATSTNVKTYIDGKRTFKATETTANVQYRINVTAHGRGTISASLVVNTNAVTGSAISVGVIKTPLDIKGDFNFNTHGHWDATIVLERNEDNAGWEPYRTYLSKVISGVGSRNVQYAGTESSDNVQYRMNVTAYTKGTVYADLAATSSNQSGIVRINGILSPTSAEVTIVSSISQTLETKQWAEGAWSTVRGYPAAIGFFEERIIYGGTANNPNRIWLSASGDFEDFEEGTKDADSFSLDIPTTNIIKWIASLEALIVGTGGKEFRIRSSRIDDPLTPSNFSIRQQTAFGSRDIQAVEVGSVILFVDSVGRKIREFVFSDVEQKHVAPDLTALAEHITFSGIVCFAHQKNPESILWCVLDNGSLLTMTYEREQNVIAWARQPIDGLVQSVAVIPSEGEDEVWISVTRAIDGDNKNYIEQFQSRYLDVRKENAFFVDSGFIHDGPLTNVITNLDHLEEKIVAILADGVVLDQQRVEDGEISLTTSARNVRVGLPYTSEATPMRMDLNLATGTTHGSIKRISEVVLSFHNTMGAKYGSSDTKLFDFDWTNVRWENDSTVEGLFTGDIIAHFDGGFNIDDPLVISQADPLPCTVRAIIPRLEKTGR